MKRNEKIALANRMINDKINETLNLWAGQPELKTYAWGWRSEDTLSSNHEHQFFYMDEVAAIVKVCGLNYRLTVGMNCDNQPTPYITIF